MCNTSASDGYNEKETIEPANTFEHGKSFCQWYPFPCKLYNWPKKNVKALKILTFDVAKNCLFVFVYKCKQIYNMHYYEKTMIQYKNIYFQDVWRGSSTITMIEV